MKKIAYTAGFLVGVFAGITAYAGEATAQQSHQEWSSRIVSDADRIAFRASTTYQDGSNQVILTLDRKPGECGIQYISMNLVGSTPAKNTFTTETLFGAIRIDEKPIHNMSYTLAFVKGETVFFATVSNFDGDKTLFDELVSGKSARFKLKSGDDEYFFRFPLNGFEQAQSRTYKLCQGMTSKKSDKDFFSENLSSPKLRIKSDKEFF